MSYKLFIFILILKLVSACAPFSTSTGSSLRGSLCSIPTENSISSAETVTRAIGSRPANSAPSWSAFLNIRFVHPTEPSQILQQGLCSGVLVARNAVITAGHCLIPNGSHPHAVPRITVSLGGTSLTNGEDHEATNFFIHPDYNDGRHLENDIAIIWLPEESNLEPARLSSQKLIEYTISNRFQNHIRILGFGVTVPNQMSSRTDYLQEIKQEIVPLNTCHYESQRAYRSKNEFLCTKTLPNEKTSTCSGDSGGPLIITTTTGEEIVAGLTSFGPPSCSGLSYATNVAQHRSWLESTLATHNSLFIDVDLHTAQTLLCF